MKELILSGGARLFGEVRVHGSKNAALPILFSCLLFSEPVELGNLPDITDVSAALSLLIPMCLILNSLIFTSAAGTVSPPVFLHSA